MTAALALARRGLGTVWPNPSVGCVLVNDGRVVGRGHTAPGGRPHAETRALEQAGPLARGATAYVSLEPCSHHGRTPPCADALIAAGVGRVVAAAEDPDPRVAGTGLERLRRAGVAVESGLCEEDARDINAGFFSRVTLGRPMVTLKLATTLDGAVATHAGESRWITGAPARAIAHRLRAEHDAIMIGSGTALHDNPDLTCRLPGLDDRSPIRIVVDSRLRLNLASRLVASAGRVPTWVFACSGNDPVRVEAMRACGVDVIEVDEDEGGRVDLAQAFAELGRRGLTRVLVEGGPRLAAALVRGALADRLVWFHAPMLLGGDAVMSLVALGVDRLGDAPRFRRVSLGEAAEDVVACLVRA